MILQTEKFKGIRQRPKGPQKSETRQKVEVRALTNKKVAANRSSLVCESTFSDTGINLDQKEDN